MRIEELVLGACITNCYIIAADSGKCVIIDPADEADKILKVVSDNNWKVEYIFITHGHTDHVLALEEVKAATNAPVVISRIDAWRLEDEELINERPYVTVPYRAVKPDVLVEHGDIIRVDELEFKFYAMPGHTPGSMAIILEDCIFSGDTLLYEGHGKTSLPGGDEDTLVASIRRMAQELTGDYKVLTGHRKHTTLEHERMNNPYIIKK